MRRKTDRFRLIKGRQPKDEREGFKEEPGAHPSLNWESSEERICALDEGIARPPQNPDPAALPPDMETHGATMAMAMDWSPSFCLACDRQTDGAVFCSEACRQAEYEAVERKTSRLNEEFLAASLSMRSKSKKQFRADNGKGAMSVLRPNEEMGTSSYDSLEVLPDGTLLARKSFSNAYDFEAKKRNLDALAASLSRHYQQQIVSEMSVPVEDPIYTDPASEDETSGGDVQNDLGSESDVSRLHGGLITIGRPAEFIRMKNGNLISIAIGQPANLDEDKKDKKHTQRFKRSFSEEAEDEDDEAIMRSMARRKRAAFAADLAPRRCREPGCEKWFKRLCDLTKHEKTHSRPWKCPVESCKYHEDGWPTEKEMDRHHNDKHSEVPQLYECHFKPCPYRSKRELNCKKHMVKAHGWTYSRAPMRRSGTNVPPDEIVSSVINAASILRDTSAVDLDMPIANEPNNDPSPSELRRKRTKMAIFDQPNTYQCTHIGKDGKHGRQSTFSIRDWKRHEQTHYRASLWECLKCVNKQYSEHNDLDATNDQPYCETRPMIPIPQNSRKVLRVLVNNTEQLACPDSGSEKNIMSEAFANENGLKISRCRRDIKAFELGSGKKVLSIGRVKTTVKLLGQTLPRLSRYFYVFAKCPVPLILGMSFLSDAEILTKNRHMLESCPDEYLNISSLLWIGAPRSRKGCKSPCNRIKCTLDGRELIGTGDTGSDLNFMSPECAEREGFDIDTREEARIVVQLGDGSLAETIGQVYIHDLSLDWRKPASKKPATGGTTSRELLTEGDKQSFGTIFHVLPGLPCDIILGRDALEEMDAFNNWFESTCSRTLTSKNAFEFNIFIFKRKRRLAAEAAPDPKELHDDERHREMLRRSRREDEISLLAGDQRCQAIAREKLLISEWDARHTAAACEYCTPV